MLTFLIIFSKPSDWPCDCNTHIMKRKTLLKGIACVENTFWATTTTTTTITTTAKKNDIKRFQTAIVVLSSAVGICHELCAFITNINRCKSTMASIPTDDLCILFKKKKQKKKTKEKILGAQQQHPLQSLFFRIAIELILTVVRSIKRSLWNSNISILHTAALCVCVWCKIVIYLHH